MLGRTILDVRRKPGHASSDLGSLRFALPDVEHAPTSFQKFCGLAHIAFAVPVDFRLPKLRIGRRCPTGAAVVPMPEAAMDKDRRSVLRKHEIGPPGEILGMKNVPQAFGVQQLSHDHLWSSVLLPNA